jgi:hypothetical protein
MERMTGGAGGSGIDPNDLTNVLRGKKIIYFLIKMNFFVIGMNQNDLASLFSSVGGGGASGLMQGSHRGRVLPGSSTQPAAPLLDAFSQQTPDSRPNTAPAGIRTTGTAAAPATGGTTSVSSTRPTGSSSSKPRNGGTSSSPSTTVPASGTSSGTSGGPRGGPIQMSALTNILANLSANSSTQGANSGAAADATASAAAAAAAKPAIDLYDIMTSEVNFII